jgi:hypothetical protein
MMNLETFQVFPTVNTNTTMCPELNVLFGSVRFVCVTYILAKKENWQPCTEKPA